MRLKESYDGVNFNETMLYTEIINGEFPTGRDKPKQLLLPKLFETFRDFEMAAYNNDSEGSILSLKDVLKGRILECIMSAEEIHDDYINQVRQVFVGMTDEEIFDCTPWDDERISAEKFIQLTLFHIDRLVELFTVRNYQGEIVEQRWYDYYYNPFRRLLMESEKDKGRFKAPKEYITLRYDVIYSIEHRTKLDDRFWSS
jgi:hypothetical protein